MIARRDFLIVGAAAVLSAGAAVLAPRLARAQQPPRIAYLSATAPGPASELFSALVRGLAERGLVEGTTLVMDRYYASGSTDVLAANARVAAASGAAVIFAGSILAARAAVDATKTVPIVFTVTDSLAYGLVTNLRRPGGNATGVNTTASLDIEGKRLELLHDLVPAARRIAYLIQPSYWDGAYGPVVRDAAARQGLTLDVALMEVPGDEAAYRRAIDGARARGAEALLVAATGENLSPIAQIGGIAAAAGLPSVGPYPDFAAGGGVLAYGASVPEMWRRAGIVVARILAGEAPGDIPVQQPEVYDLIVNLGAAKRLGITVPLTLTSQATQVIE